MRQVIVAAALVLASCGGTVVESRPESVPTPILQPCVKGEVKTPVIPMLKAVPDARWAGLDLPQRLGEIGLQADRRMTSEEQVRAQTAGCPVIETKG